MKRTLIAALAFAAVVLLAGCASGPAVDPNYAARLEFIERQAAADRQQFDAIAQAAERCTKDECVTQVAALAALALAGGRGTATPAIEPYRKQFHPAWNLLGVLVPQLANAVVSWHQSDNARDISVAQFDFLGGVINDVSQSPALRSPSVTVGGDYIPGSQHIGDAVGGDYITGHVGDAVGGDQVGGNQHVGDAVGGDQVGGDAIGGDRVDGDGNYNSGRIGSDGPIDNSGDECDGEGCQGTPPPDPVPAASGG